MLSIFAKRRKQQPLDRRRSLAGIPMINEKITVDDSEGEDCLVISMTLPERHGLIGRLLPTAGTKRIRLDELGSFVLAQIDGKKNRQGHNRRICKTIQNQPPRNRTERSGVPKRHAPTRSHRNPGRLTTPAAPRLLY